VKGLGFRVYSLGVGVQVVRLNDWCTGCKVQGLWCDV